MRRSRSAILRTLAFLSIAGLVPVACQSPLASPEDDRLSDAVEAGIRSSTERQLAQVAAQPSVAVGSTETEVDRMLAPRRSELEKMGPQSAALGTVVSGVVPLTAEAPTRVVLSLRSAVVAAVRNNLDVQTAQLEKAITDADVVRAEAAFDWVLGAGAGYQRVDQPTVGILFPGSTETVIPNVTNQRNWSFDAGIGRQLETGGSLSLTAASSRVNNVDSALYTPDPAWQSAVNHVLTQPLLR